MKKIKLILLMVYILIPICTQGQTGDADTIYYDYELVADEILSDGDTVYQAFLLIEKESVSRFSRLVVISQSQEKSIKVKEKDFSKEAFVDDLGDTYRIAIDQWSDIEGWMVFGEKEDKSKQYLVKKEQKEMIKHKVIETPLPIDYSLRKKKDKESK